VPAAPGLAEALLVALRWLHALSAIVFLGWSAVLWLDGPPRGDREAARQRFKEITELIALRLDPDTSCADVKARAQTKLALWLHRRGH